MAGIEKLEPKKNPWPVRKLSENSQDQEYPEYNIGRKSQQEAARQAIRPIEEFRAKLEAREKPKWPKRSNTLSPVIYIEHEERSTSYRIVMTELPAEGANRETAPMLVALLSPHGAVYTFQFGKNQGPLHWSYIGEKFKLGRVDAEIVAKLVAQELNREFVEPGAYPIE